MRYLLSHKILYRSDKRFHFFACATLHTPLWFGRLIFEFFPSPTAKIPALILTNNTSKDAAPRKDMLFGGPEAQIKNLDHFLPKRAILGPILDLVIFY